MRRSRLRVLLASASAIAASAVLLASGGRAHAARAAATAAPAPHVLVTTLTGVVSPVMEEALAQALERAERENAAALVLEIDTPGGLESSMRDMVEKLLASPRPVIAWVTPSGAHAASAGVFIVMACDVAAMSPGTNIGAATPISMSGPMDSTLARKATNDAAAFARTVAAQRGRNEAWAERAVREAVAIDEREAVHQHVVDFVAGDLDDLLAKADTLTWRRGALARHLGTRGLAVTRIEPGIRERLLGRLADPNVAYLLMMLGFYGLLFELQNPGAVLPGVVGGICLLLAFFALSTLPVNSAGVALLVLGLAFLLAEIKVHSHGLLALGGAIALALGSLMLFRPGTVSVSWPFVLVGTGTTVVFFVAVVGAGVRARRLPVVTGAAGLVGRRGVALERLAPEGRVRIGGEVWAAASAVPLDPGVAVEVLKVEGLRLEVKPILQEG
ncbi:MAG TPA: nodulation protein NfeD [Candidatus Acidoferrales bacterium]|nr:nodulation protein NfeD [Candidatus Acidoferrales bacterium]